MGTHRLELIDTADFYEWVNALGYSNEHEFWESLSGLSSGTTYDHMNYYLTTLGYTGNTSDMFKQFLIDQTTAQAASVTNLGTLYDWANCLYDLGFDVGSVNTILDDDGNIVRDDDGNIVTD